MTRIDEINRAIELAQERERYALAEAERFLASGCIVGEHALRTQRKLSERPGQGAFRHSDTDQRPRRRAWATGAFGMTYPTAMLLAYAALAAVLLIISGAFS